MKKRDDEGRYYEAKLSGEAIFTFSRFFFLFELPCTVLAFPLGLLVLNEST